MRSNEKRSQDDKSVPDPSAKQKGGEAYLVGSAYIGQPTREKALVFVYGGQEYLVPVTNQWDGYRVIESTVYLNKVERVVERPKGTSCISAMRRCKNISDNAKEALHRAVRAWFLPEKGYEAKIILFDDV